MLAIILINGTAFDNKHCHLLLLINVIILIIITIHNNNINNYYYYYNLQLILFNILIIKWMLIYK